MPWGAVCGLSARADLPLPLTKWANGPGDLRLGLPIAGIWMVNNNSASLLLSTYCVPGFWQTSLHAIIPHPGGGHGFISWSQTKPQEVH